MSGILFSKKELEPILQFLSEKTDSVSRAMTNAAIDSLFRDNAGDFRGYEWNRDSRTWRSHEAVFYRLGIFEKLEALVRILIGKDNLDGVTVIENGPGDRAVTSAILALMGADVIIKEPDESDVESHRKFAAKIDEAARGKVSYRVTREEIDRPSPARLVIWANPSFDELMKYLGMDTDDKDIVRRELFGKSESVLPKYLSRDVEEGGYLVIQTEISEYLAAVPPGDPEWEEVWSGKVNFRLLPTFHHGGAQHIYIYRRKKKGEK